MCYATHPGSRFPPGATALPGGVNFCVFSRHATRMELLLYEQPTSSQPFQLIALDPEHNRSFFFWHVFVTGLPCGTWYTWRADGPQDTQHTGRFFNPRKELVDPWARAVSDAAWDRRRAADPADASHTSIRAVVTATPPQGEPHSVRGLKGAVIYELHAGGFTRHPSSGAADPGTFAGLIEKIPYLRDLGVTHVELLPAMAFDEQHVPATVAARGLSNYWGYSTHSFFSPHPRYCIDPARAVDEFRLLTRALHDADIKVLLDVVFNHTAEGGAEGPIINFKGFARDIFYHLDAADRRRFRDYTGTGNTVNCNHPLVTAFIVRCLEYWVEEMGVDGFRFDLASVFARNSQGELMDDPPLPWAIETSRVLAPVPLIAEAWDAAGLYHVGAFPGMAWSEWNGRYRDVMRRFIRGDPGLVGEAATRIAGSADMYAGNGRLPGNSINLVTCHDGFTLWDLVSYASKHNITNGEDNRDGTDDNASWNCGVEGETADPQILALRRRQAKNFLAVLMLSRGVPMLLAGDEVLRTQGGNNNAWCQNNAVSWFDWARIESERDMLRFTRELIALRHRHHCLTANRFFTGKRVPGRELQDIAWHGATLAEPTWTDGQGRFLRFTISGLAADEEDLHVILNMSEDTVDCDLPSIPGRRWYVAVDTSHPSANDIIPRSRQVPHPHARYSSRNRSVVVLEARGVSL